MKLKNGSDVPDAIVAATMVTVKMLFESDPVAFFELVSKARDPRHEFWSESIAKRLAALGLLDAQGGVHRAVADVVASAARGEGLAMTLGNPRGPA